jgi:dihydrofolate reductase
MRELVVTENITLDGVVEMRGGWFAPGEGGDDVAAANREHMAAADAVLLGRVTYQEFASYWPKQTDDQSGVADYLDRTQKYVVSSTLERADWQNTTIIQGSLVEGLAALKKRPGKAIVVTGSIELAQTLLRGRGVDELRLFVYPRVIGQGRRLFPEGLDRSLRLAEARAFGSGVVLLRYRLTR